MVALTEKSRIVWEEKFQEFFNVVFGELCLAKIACQFPHGLLILATTWHMKSLSNRFWDGSKHVLIVYKLAARGL
ncbi:MAG TPA: hypothetical protein DHW22_10180 [Planctomycetaceae bacterium]|nr:hypothetical protein [Planctomycetaceae bacterium]